jgi:putative resolvase
MSWRPRFSAWKGGFSSRYAKAYTITDIGSDLNARRRELRKVLEPAGSRSIRAIAITHKDRLTRFGYEHLEAFFQAHDVELLMLYPDEEQTAEEELVSDMITLVPALAGRLYGRRSQKTKAVLECVRQKADP